MQANAAQKESGSAAKDYNDHKFELYHGNNSFSGSSFAIEDRTYKPKPYLFLSIARQNNGKNENGNFTFDHQGNATFQIGTADMMKLLFITGGRTKSMKLFHKYNGGNTQLTVEEYEGGLSFNISKKSGSSEPNRVAFRMSPEEAYCFKVLMEKYVTRSFSNNF